MSTFKNVKKIFSTSLFGISLLMGASSLQAATSEILQSGLDALDNQDYETAAQVFAESYEAGEGDAAFYLGRMYELGIGTDVDMRQAAGLYQLSADKDSALGQNRLALVYIRGESGVLQDYTKALEILEVASKTDNADAQFNYAVMLESGWGTKVDLAAAFDWYNKAAKGGHIGAQNKLALAYRDGLGVKQSANKALLWFSEAGAQNNPLGLFEIANAFELGEGRSLQAGTAYMLFNLAAATGLEEAANRRDQLLAQLSSDEINTFQSKAREWVELSEKDRLKILLD